jgi:hypothetical protein
MFGDVSHRYVDANVSCMSYPITEGIYRNETYIIYDSGTHMINQTFATPLVQVAWALRRLQIPLVEIVALTCCFTKPSLFPMINLQTLRSLYFMLARVLSTTLPIISCWMFHRMVASLTRRHVCWQAQLDRVEFRFRLSTLLFSISPFPDLALLASIATWTRRECKA